MCCQVRCYLVSHPRSGDGVVAVSATTTLFIICWQFAQFMLFTQTTAVFGIYLLGVLPQESMHSILVAQVNQGSFICFPLFVCETDL